MKVDIQDVLFWMDAIRNSDDRYRTLESFWKGQVNSKIWLIENLEKCVQTSNNNIVIHGGWNGVLASLLFNSSIDINKITSVDLDPSCEETSYTVNKRQEVQGRYEAVSADMCCYVYDRAPNVVVNTSCEHITPQQYKAWLENVPGTSLVVVQSNNYYDLDEHINCHPSLESFQESANLDVVYAGELVLPKYTRYMIIGFKP